MDDGEIDAYWWVLCTEKYFKHWRTPETLKMIVAGLAMKGPPLTWWLRWYPHHRWMNWDAFTTVFLWQFKPEWRIILPLPDDEEEPISESLPLSEPYFDSVVTDSAKIVDDLSEPAPDNVQMIGEFRREDGFGVQRDTKLMVITTGDCNSGIVATPELPNADLPSSNPFCPSTKPITTHSFHNEDTSPQSKVTIDDVAINQGLSLHCEIPHVLHFMSIVNNHASSLKPKFRLHWGNLLAEIKEVPLTASIQTCLSYVRQNVPTHSPPPKPSDCAVSNPLLPLKPPNMNQLLSPPPPKPPDHNFQLKQGEFQVTQVLVVPPSPPEPPDIDHTVVVLQGFATLMFPSLTGLRSLYRNGYSVTDPILESLSILPQLVILDVFDSNPDTMISIFLSTGQLVNARYVLDACYAESIHVTSLTLVGMAVIFVMHFVGVVLFVSCKCYVITQQWNFVKVQQKGKGNITLDVMCVSYENSGTLGELNCHSHNNPKSLQFFEYGFIHGLLDTNTISILSLLIGYDLFGFLYPFDPPFTPITKQFPSRKYCDSLLLNVHVFAISIRDRQPLNTLGIDTFYCGYMISNYALNLSPIVFTVWYLDLSATSLYVAKFITSSTTLFGYILKSIPTKYASDHKCLLLLAIIDNGYVVIPTFNIKPVLAYTTVRSKQTIKLAQVLIFATWQQISSSDSMSFLYTCASCENFQDLNGDNKSKNEGGNLTMTLIIIAPHVECFSFIGLDDGSSWTHHGNLILTGGNGDSHGDSLYLWKYAGDDRRVLYIGFDTKILAMKKSNEFKRKFLWIEVFLVELVFVLIPNSLITVAILQVFANQLGTYKKVRKPNWGSFHFRAAHDLQRAESGVYYFSHTARALQFKQWDPGGCCLVNRECPLDLEILGKLFCHSTPFILASTLRTRLMLKGKVL